MIVVKLQGGMGNQMFQYAFGRYLAIKHNVELKLDLSFLSARPKKLLYTLRDYDLGIFNIQENFASEEEVFKFCKRVGIEPLDRFLIRKLGTKKTHIIESQFHFSEYYYNLPDNVYLEGYFQTEKYFESIKDIIKNEFTIKEDLQSNSKALIAQIENTNSICVNIRRGDFVVNDFHGSYGIDYFKKAEETLLNHVFNPHFFVFSDEIDWCIENLKFKVPTTFISHDYAGKKFQDYLRLMSACKHFIIPNSSFAWWAVYLSKNEDRIVVAPKVWFTDSSWDTSDLTPQSWIRL